MMTIKGHHQSAPHSENPGCTYDVSCI